MNYHSSNTIEVAPTTEFPKNRNLSLVPAAQKSAQTASDQTKFLMPDKETARRHIELLHRAGDAIVTFFLVKDFVMDGQDKNPHHVYGTLDQHWEYLASKNQQGYGILILVQQGNGIGRTKQDIIGLNALFTDDDKGLPTPIFKLPPSFTVRSKHGCHQYWLLKPGEPLNRLEEAQETLAAHFGTDPIVKDLSRVMRLAGTYNMKDPADPFLVELVVEND
jgi:hypothetical protein